MTDPATSLEPAGALNVNPATGEALSITDAPVGRLFDELYLIGEHVDRIADYRRALERELVARADRRAVRSVTADGCDYTVNAPTTDDYDLAILKRELGPLIADGTIDREFLDALIVQPPRPPAPAPRVDKRAIARLLKSDDRRLLAAIAAARRRVPNNRTVKLTARAIDTTAEEA